MHNQDGSPHYSLPSFGGQGIVKQVTIEKEEQKEKDKYIFRLFVAYINTFDNVILINRENNLCNVHGPNFNMFVKCGFDDIILRCCYKIKHRFIPNEYCIMIDGKKRYSKDLFNMLNELCGGNFSQPSKDYMDLFRKVIGSCLDYTITNETKDIVMVRRGNLPELPIPKTYIDLYDACADIMYSPSTITIGGFDLVYEMYLRLTPKEKKIRVNTHKQYQKESKMETSNKTTCGQNNAFFDMLRLVKYEAIFDDGKYVIVSTSTKIVIENDVVEIYNYCLELYDIVVDYPPIVEQYKELLNNFFNSLTPEQQHTIREGWKTQPKKEEKSEGNMITFHIVRQERKDLINEIAETTKKLLSFEDKTSWMYNDIEKQLEYQNAKFVLIEQFYNKFK